MTKPPTDSVLRQYFGKYLPDRALPSLAEFCSTDTFALFDEVVALQSPKPRGEARRRFLEETSDCLAYVLVNAHGGTALSSEFGPCIEVGDMTCHHEAWVTKCLSNPIADSIRAKAIVFLGPREHQIESGALTDAALVEQLCTDLGCAEWGERLHGTTLRSLDLFAREVTGDLLPADRSAGLSPRELGLERRRVFRDAIIELFQEVLGSTIAETFAGTLVAAKLRDYARSSMLNSKRYMQFVPDEVTETLLARLDEKVPFSHMVAGLAYVQDAPVDGNGDLFGAIWTLWKRSSPPSEAELLEAIGLLLRLIEKKLWHHDIKEFKRVLKLIPPEHCSLLARFDPQVRLGCFQLIAELFGERCQLAHSTRIELLGLLDTARGTLPSAAWEKKQQRLRATDEWTGVLRIAGWIREREHLKKPLGSAGWSDSIFARFYKAAGWIEEG